MPRKVIAEPPFQEFAHVIEIVVQHTAGGIVGQPHGRSDTNVYQRLYRGAHAACASLVGVACNQHGQTSFVGQLLDRRV